MGILDHTDREHDKAQAKMYRQGAANWGRETVRRMEEARLGRSGVPGGWLQAVYDAAKTAGYFGRKALAYRETRKRTR